jgi:integrase
VARLHRQLGEKHPYGANRLLELLSKMYELARVWGVVEEDYTNPARGIPKFREEKRDRWITPEELPRLAKAIDEEPNRPARAALWLYLLTGLRKSELLSLRWSDIDDHRQEIRLGRTKSGRSHYVPLSEAARKILQEIPRLEDNAYVFPGAKPGHHLVNIDKPWRRVRQSAGIEDVRLHDLRRTMGSWLAQAGNSLHLIGRVLNHSTPSTTQVYARFGNDHVRSALESYGKQLMGVAGRTPRAPVISYTEKLDYAAVSMEPKKPAVGD